MKKILIGLGAVFLLCAIVGIIGNAAGANKSTVTPTAAAGTALAQATAQPKSESTQVTPTLTPRMAVTVFPSPTVKPTSSPPMATATSPAPTAPSPTSVEAKIIEVVDGDTIKVSLAAKTETIRIIGIDTPEVVDPREPVQCFGREASAKAKELLGGQQVRLVSDSTQADRDRYNRLLRYVELSDGTDYGLWMIANGYAHEYTYEIPYQRQVQYKAAYREARERSVGFWAPDTCNGDTKKPALVPTPTKQAVPAVTPGVKTGSAQPVGSSCPEGYPIKGNLSSSGEKIYHVPGGQFYDRTNPEECFATTSDAEAAGYRRSQR